MNLTLTITWILVIARWIIAIQLTRVALRQKLPNLLWLAAFFYVTGTGDIFMTLSPLTNLLWPFNLAVGLGEVALVMFIQKTFYRDRKSPWLIFMVIALALLVADMVYATFLPYYSPFNWIWLIWVGYKAYKQIAADRAVEDWVKVRYKLVIAYSLAALVAPLYTVLMVIALYIIPAFAMVLFATNVTLVAQVGILVFVTIGIALEYLAWVMPEGYRKWLNRNYQPPEPDNAELNLSEEEIMRKLKARP
jgi:uncharacterized membrane protein (DUF485 family)